MTDENGSKSAFDSFEMSLNDIGHTERDNIAELSVPRRRRRTQQQPTDDAGLIRESQTDQQINVTVEDNRPQKSAKKSKDKTSGKKKTLTSTPGTLFSDSKLSVFAGVILIVFAAYALLSMLSFLAGAHIDQSLVQNNDLASLGTRAAEIRNAGGPVGAWLADFFLSRWLGIGSFAVIIYAAILGVSLLRLRKCHFFSLTFKTLISAISVSVIAGAICYTSPHTWYFGGEHGHAVNEFFLLYTGVWGDVAINIILFTALILIFFDTIHKAFKFIGTRYSKYKSRMPKLSEEQNDENVERLDMSTSATTGVMHEANDDADSKGSVDNLENNVDEAPSVQFEDIPIASREITSTDTTTDEANALSDNPFDAESPTAEIIKPQSNEVMPSDHNEAKMEIEVNQIEEAKQISTDAYDPTAELSRYKLPSVELLREYPDNKVSEDREEQEANKERITRTLRSYGIEIQSIKATVGPTITLYEIVPAEGVKVNKIKNLGNDLALSLSALGIRIIAPIPGKGTIGMEVPNRDKQIVSIRSILTSAAYQESHAALPIAMGTNIANEVYVTDLAKMPHLLVAGATGMGKSVGLNTIIASLLFKKHPAELKFVLVDPKMVEFSLYSVLERHFLAKLPEAEEAIITDPSKVMDTLNSLCVEMDRRYELLRKAGVRDIKSYNAKFVERRLNPENGHRFLPYIVVIVDEFADLILTAGKEVETPISRIAAKARAIGIHMILATQRPSVNVITGVIKANFPGRIAFRVNQMNDSRTILDRPGADQLIGRGDMIISKDGVMERVQCALIETDEVENICKFISEQIGYPTAYELPEYVAPTEVTGFSAGTGERDPLFEEAGRFIIESGIGSTTSIQRRFNVGFPRAGKVMDQLEMAGVVGPSKGGKPRAVLMDLMSFDDMIITGSK